MCNLWVCSSQGQNYLKVEVDCFCKLIVEVDCSETEMATARWLLTDRFWYGHGANTAAKPQWRRGCWSLVGVAKGWSRVIPVSPHHPSLLYSSTTQVLLRTYLGKTSKIVYTSQRCSTSQRRSANWNVNSSRGLWHGPVSGYLGPGMRPLENLLVKWYRI